MLQIKELMLYLKDQFPNVMDNHFTWDMAEHVLNYAAKHCDPPELNGFILGIIPELTPEELNRFLVDAQPVETTSNAYKRVVIFSTIDTRNMYEIRYNKNTDQILNIACNHENMPGLRREPGVQTVFETYLHAKQKDNDITFICQNQEKTIIDNNGLKAVFQTKDMIDTRFYLNDTEIKRGPAFELMTILIHIAIKNLLRNQ